MYLFFFYLSDKGSAVAGVLFSVSIVCLKEVSDREVPFFRTNNNSQYKWQHCRLRHESNLSLIL